MQRQFIFRTDEDLAQAIAEACSREERTFSSLARFAIRKYLNERAQPVEAGPFKTGVWTTPLMKRKPQHGGQHRLVQRWDDAMTDFFAELGEERRQRKGLRAPDRLPTWAEAKRRSAIQRRRWSRCLILSSVSICRGVDHGGRHRRAPGRRPVRRRGSQRAAGPRSGQDPATLQANPNLTLN